MNGAGHPVQHLFAGAAAGDAEEAEDREEHREELHERQAHRRDDLEEHDLEGELRDVLEEEVVHHLPGEVAAFGQAVRQEADRREAGAQEDGERAGGAEPLQPLRGLLAAEGVVAQAQDLQELLAAEHHDVEEQQQAEPQMRIPGHGAAAGLGVLAVPEPPARGRKPRDEGRDGARGPPLDLEGVDPRGEVGRRRRPIRRRGAAGCSRAQDHRRLVRLVARQEGLELLVLVEWRALVLPHGSGPQHRRARHDVREHVHEAHEAEDVQAQRPETARLLPGLHLRVG